MPPDAWSNAAIAERLIALRDAHGMKQNEFSEFLELSPTAWNNYELAKGRISLDAARQVLRKTGASLDWIYYGNPAAMPISLMNRVQAALRKAG